MMILNRRFLTIVSAKVNKFYIFSRLIFTTNPLQRKIKKFEDIPGPYSAPLIGTLYQYLPMIGPYRFDKLEINGMKKLRKYGPLVREEIVPGSNIVWIFDPDDIKTLLKSDDNLYPRRASHLALEKYRLDRPHVYNTGGLLPTNGSEWKRIRSAFQKGLSSPADVVQFLPGANEIVQEWIDQRIFQIYNEPSIDYLPEISRLFLELIGYVALDIRLDSFASHELEKNSRSSKLLHAALTTNSAVLKTDNGPQLWRKFETPLFRQLRKSQEFMESVAIDLLSFKMSTFKEIGSRTTLLEKYLANCSVDFKDIIGMVCDFFLAGMDTTAYTTSFVLYHLAKNPDAQEKLYSEAKKLLPLPQQPLAQDKYEDANYAKAVLKETFRLNPISVGIGRILNKEIVLSDYLVPPNTIAVTQNQVICRLEKYFNNPEEFCPERWIESKKYHPYLLLPFGQGIRSCIARRFAEQNIILLMLKLVRVFEIGWNGDVLDTKSFLINKPDRPVTLILKKRLC